MSSLKKSNNMSGRRGSMDNPNIPPPLENIQENISIIQSMEGMNVFITGATGFVGKVLLEKILRSIPSCGKLIILVRPRKGSTAAARVQKEIVQSEVFNRLRSERPDCTEYILSKLHIVPGELTRPNMGLSDEDLEFCKRNVNIVLHIAAITDFNQRIDKAMEMNTMGIRHIYTYTYTYIYIYISTPTHAP